jgi:hypothetical protein
VWLSQFSYGQNIAAEKARIEADRIRELVDAGAVPKVALERAQQDVAEAEDEAALVTTLYGQGSIEDLTPDLVSEMVGAAERQVERQMVRISARRQLVDQGVLARTELTPLLAELERRQRVLDLARSRARLLDELSKMAQVEQDDLEPLPQERPGPVPVKERFDGNGRFTTRDYRRVSAAYKERFGRPMPVSANGQSGLHRRMGYDHRGRVDVALNPDQEEGRWLRSYLEQLQLPYYAFRAAVRGSATGAHIHMGPPSTRRVVTVSRRSYKAPARHRVSD